MIQYYIIAGCIILTILYLILNKFLNRETRWLKLRDFYEKQMDYIMAIDFAQKLINLRKHKPEYYLKLAELYEKAKMIPSAIEIYNNMLKNKIFSHKIKEHNIREKIAFLNIETGKIVEAFKELCLIVKDNPNSPYANALLGRIYGSQLKYEKAEKYIKKAISLNDTIAEFHYLLGILYLDKGELSQAIVELDKAYQLDPTNVKATYFLALACRQKGLNEKTKMLFEKLNLKDTSSLPSNITQVAIMAQDIPRFDIDSLEKSLEEEKELEKEKNTQKANSIEELLQADTTTFYNTAVSVISKLGYIIKKDIKSNLIDSNSELHFLAISKKNKDNPQAPLCFIQFTRTISEIGSIPIADFISRIHENKASSGIFITTSSFAQAAQSRINKEKISHTLIDGNKLTRYL